MSSMAQRLGGGLELGNAAEGGAVVTVLLRRRRMRRGEEGQGFALGPPAK